MVLGVVGRVGPSAERTHAILPGQPEGGGSALNPVCRRAHS